MALTITGRGSGTHNTGASSFTLNPSGNFAAGSTAVLLVTADNSASQGASNDFSSVTDTLGNTWTAGPLPIFDNGAASAGIQGAQYYTYMDAGTLQSGTTITVNFGSSPVAKGWSLYEIAPGAGNKAVYVTGGVNTGSTATNPTVTTGTINVGEVVFGGYHSENVNATTGDSDTTNGSWVTQVSVTVGSGTSGIRHSSQYKIQTTTASTQTFNPTTGTAQDCILSWTQFKEATTVSGSFTASSAIKRTETGSFTASSVVKQTGIAGSFTAESVIKKTGIAGSLTAEAVIKKIVDGSFSAEAVLASAIGTPTWVSPSNGSNISSQPTLEFTMPSSISNMYFHIQLDKVNTFNGGDLRDIKSHLSQTGWEYYNGATWVAVPAGGVPNTYSGNNCRYTVQTPLSNGTWYRRVRVGN